MKNLKQYIDSIKFGLTDYNRTFEKYKEGGEINVKNDIKNENNLFRQQKDKYEQIKKEIGEEDVIRKNIKRISEIDEELELRNYEYDKKHSYTKEIDNLPRLIKELELEKSKLKKEIYDISSIISENKRLSEIEFLKTLNKNDLVTTVDGYTLKVIKKDGKDNYLSVFNEDFKDGGVKWYKGDNYNLHINEVSNRNPKVESGKLLKKESILLKLQEDAKKYKNFEDFYESKFQKSPTDKQLLGIGVPKSIIEESQFRGRTSLEDVHYLLQGGKTTPIKQQPQMNQMRS